MGPRGWFFSPQFHPPRGQSWFQGNPISIDRTSALAEPAEPVAHFSAVFGSATRPI